MAAPGARARGALALLLCALVVLPLVGGAAAQSLTAPPRHAPFEDSYYVYGRVVDIAGNPVWGANLSLSFDHPTIRAATVPVRSDCHGDFAGLFRLGEVPPRMVFRVRHDSESSVEASAKGDAYMRRSDFVLTLPRERTGYETPGPLGSCPDVSDYWSSRYTFAGRIVRHDANASAANSTPAVSPVTNHRVLSMYFLPIPDVEDAHQPIAPNFQFSTSAQGDFTYSWVLEGNLSSGFIIAVVEGKRFNLTLDFHSRVSYVPMLVGDPEEAARADERPAPAPGLLGFLAVVAVALLSRNRRR